jgi:hypothetical protein
LQFEFVIDHRCSQNPFTGPLPLRQKLYGAACHRIYSARSQHLKGNPTRQFSLSVRELAQTPVTGPEVPFTWTQSLPAPNNAHSIRISKLHRSIAPADVEELLHDAGVEMYVAILRNRHGSAVWSRDNNIDTESGCNFPSTAFIFRPMDPHLLN